MLYKPIRRNAALLSACAVLYFATAALCAPPIRLHPDNPRWLDWRGKAIALITSAEHYGAVLNPDFHFRRYLETLQRDGMNYTRIFAGSYVEPQGAFGIERNTISVKGGEPVSLASPDFTDGVALRLLPE